jgi:hypothetical protein
MPERSNTSSAKPQKPADPPKIEAAKLSRDSHGLQFRIEASRPTKCKPTKIKV